MRRVLILAALAISLAASSAWGAHGKFVVVTVGSASLDNFMAPGLPNIARLRKAGAIGVMNARPASVKAAWDDSSIGRYSMEGGCATIGAGTRAAATTDARKAFDASDSIDGRPARQLYESLYGSGPGDAEVLQLGMNRLLYVNSDAKYPIEPGAVGSALRAKGLKTAVIGNSDTPNDFRREAALIAVDTKGIIDYGDVGASMVLRDPAAPYGVRTDPNAVLSAFRKNLGRADLIVVDLGDTSRAATYVRHCSEQQAVKLQQKALEDTDRIIGALTKELDLSRDCILIVSPNPSVASVENLDFLPPVIAAGNGIGRGLLSSGSTQRLGIITNADLSATILNYFDIALPCSFVGRPLEALHGPPESIVAINQAIIRQIERQPMMRGMATFLVVLVIVLSLYVLQRRWKISRLAAWIALVPIALMLAVLWLPAVSDTSLAGTVAILAGLVIGILVLAWAVTRSATKSFAWLCAAVAVTVIVDVFRGDHLLSRSIMSYTPVDGARYYGIGNEHMGSAISAGIIACGFIASLLGKQKALRTVLLSIVSAILVIAIGLPSLGANAGGAMSAMAAVACGLLLWREKPVTKKHILIIVGSVFGALGLMLLVDLMRPGGSQSHVGRAAHAIASGGAEQMLIIIGRKISMNWKLLQYSAWSKLLIASVASVGLMLWTKSFDVLSVLRRNKPVHSGIIAAVSGAIAALIFNDSGVVAAATAFIYVWTSIVLASFEANKDMVQDPKLPDHIRASEACPAQPTGHL